MVKLLKKKWHPRIEFEPEDGEEPVSISKVEFEPEDDEED